MPNLKAAKKAFRQSERRHLRNLQLKRSLKKTIKTFQEYTKAQNWQEAKNFLPTLYKSLDKAAKRGVLKKNTASRMKSRLSQKISS